jgi:hypothetical protein
MDTTRQCKKDIMHTVAGNVKMCFALTLDVGEWRFTDKRRKAEAVYGILLLLIYSYILI